MSIMLAQNLVAAMFAGGSAIIASSLIDWLKNKKDVKLEKHASLRVLLGLAIIILGAIMVPHVS